MENTNEDFKPSDFITTPLGSEGIAGLQSRGISRETIMSCRVAGDSKNIIFNYYDRNNEIVFSKYRGINEKSFFTKGKKRLLYNLGAIKSSDTAIICEGELDVLSFHEADLKIAVSVDYGAPNANATNVDSKLKCIETCSEQLSKIKKIYLACDADENGKRLNEELARRLGKSRCLNVEFPDDCKDANDVLVKYGPEKLRECIANAQSIPITGVIRLEQVYPAMVDQYNNGLKKGVSTGISSLDGHFSWLPGELTLFTGLPNSGKSEMVKFMLSKMVRQGWKFAVFSPETYPASSFYMDWVHTFTGRNADPEYPDQMPFEEFREASEYLKSHIYYVYPEGNEKHTPGVIREKIKEMSLEYGISGYVLDPWNMLLHEEMGNREDLYISDQLTQFTKVNHEHDLCGIIIAHPKALQPGTVPNPYHHISGGPMFINKCDNAITIHRPNYTTDKMDPQVDFMIEKIRRQKLVGIPTTVSFAYSRKTAQYTDLNSSQFPVSAKVMISAQEEVDDFPF